MRIPWGLPAPVPGPNQLDPYGELEELPDVQRAAVERFRAEDPKKYERLVAIDGGANCLIDKSGERHSISFNEEEVAKMRDGENVVVMHNHPAGRTFSRGDLQHGGTVRPSRMVVIGLGNTYELEPGPGGWPDQNAAFEVYNQAQDAARGVLQKKYGHNEQFLRGKAKDDLDEMTIDLVAKSRGLRYRRKAL